MSREIKPTNDFTYLWNDLPDEERHRLLPHMLESQKLHIWQVKQKAIKAHKLHMRELNDWLKNIDDELRKIKLRNTSAGDKDE